MKLIKLTVFIVILLVLFKNRSHFHFPVSFQSNSQVQLQEQIQELEQEISSRHEIITGIYADMAKAPAVGTVVGHTACGGKITVVDNGGNQMLVEASRLQGEIDTFERDLQKAKQQLAASKGRQ